MRIRTAVDSDAKERGVAVRKGIEFISEGERQADEYEARMLTLGASYEPPVDRRAEQGMER